MLSDKEIHYSFTKFHINNFNKALDNCLRHEMMNKEETMNFFLEVNSLTQELKIDNNLTNQFEEIRELIQKFFNKLDNNSVSYEFLRNFFIMSGVEYNHIKGKVRSYTNKSIKHFDKAYNNKIKGIQCAYCHNFTNLKRCSGCNTKYCSIECQKVDWENHRKICN